MRHIFPLLFIISIAAAAEEPSGSHRSKGKFESREFTVIDLQAASKDGFEYKAIQIDFEGKKIWISSMMPIVGVKIGDSVNVMIIMNEMNLPGKNAPSKIMSFMVTEDYAKEIKAKIEQVDK